MSDAIASNEPTAALRTVTFQLRNKSDNSVKTDLTGHTALISYNGAAGTPSGANYAHVEQGRCSVVLARSEVNVAPGTKLAVYIAEASDFYCIPWLGQVGTLAMLSEPSDISGLATTTDLDTSVTSLATSLSTINSHITAPISSTTTAIAQEVAMTLNGKRGNRQLIDKTALTSTLYGPDGTTIVSKTSIALDVDGNIIAIGGVLI